MIITNETTQNKTMPKKQDKNNNNPDYRGHPHLLGAVPMLILISYVYVKHHTCLFCQACCCSAAKFFSSRFPLRGKQGAHRYITCVDPGQAVGAMSIQRRWAGSFFQGAVFRLAAQVEQVNGKPHIHVKIVRSHLAFWCSLRFPV